MTLAREFAKLITEDGWYVVYIARNPAKQCTRCTDQTPDAHCPVCLGLGRPVVARPLKVRNSQVGRANTEEQQETALGAIGANDQHYYCGPGVSPHELDLILEVTWSSPDVLTRGRVQAVHRVYQINHIDTKRGEGGELAFYRLGVHDLDIDVRWLTTILRDRPTR